MLPDSVAPPRGCSLPARQIRQILPFHCRCISYHVILRIVLHDLPERVIRLVPVALGRSQQGGIHRFERRLSVGVLRHDGEVPDRGADMPALEVDARYGGVDVRRGCAVGLGTEGLKEACRSGVILTMP